MSAGSILRPTGRASSDRSRWSEGFAADRSTRKWSDNARDQIGNPAVRVRIQVHAVPAVAEYDTWLAANIGKRAHTRLTGSKLRRIVHMMRTGSTAVDAERACGLCGGTVARWLARLPAELRP